MILEKDQVENTKSSQFYECGYPLATVRIAGNNDDIKFMDKATFMDTEEVSALNKCDFEYLYLNFNPGGFVCFNWPYACGISLD